MGAEVTPKGAGAEGESESEGPGADSAAVAGGSGSESGSPGSESDLKRAAGGGQWAADRELWPPPHATVMRHCLAAETSARCQRGRGAASVIQRRRASCGATVFRAPHCLRRGTSRVPDSPREVRMAAGFVPAPAVSAAVCQS